MTVAHSGDLLSIVIVSYNTRNFLRCCLEALERYPASTPQEVIVIDNASADGSAEMVAQEFSGCRVVSLDRNVGYGSAVNIAIQQARGEWLLLLNPDAEVGPGSLDVLMEFARTHPDAGVISPRLIYNDGQPQASARRFNSSFLLLLEASRLHLCLPDRLRGRLMLGTYFPQDRTMEVPWVSGACHLIPLKVWQMVGPLTEETFCGSDDYDYCYRVRRHGYQVWLCSESTVTHHCSVAVRNRWTSWEVEQVATHNFYVVMESHWPKWRVKAYAAAEIVCWMVEMLRHRLQPRGEEPGLAALYTERLKQRLKLQSDIFWGRIKPIRRCDPSGQRSVISRTAYGTDH